MKHNEADHSIFYCHAFPRKCVYLIVYIDDIFITRNYATKISQFKEHLCNHFQTKDLGSLKYSLGIVVSQRKYALDI